MDSYSVAVDDATQERQYGFEGLANYEISQMNIARLGRAGDQLFWPSPLSLVYLVAETLTSASRKQRRTLVARETVSTYAASLCANTDKPCSQVFDDYRLGCAR